MILGENEFSSRFLPAMPEGDIEEVEKVLTEDKSLSARLKRRREAEGLERLLERYSKEELIRLRDEFHKAPTYEYLKREDLDPEIVRTLRFIAYRMETTGQAFVQKPTIYQKCLLSVDISQTLRAWEKYEQDGVEGVGLGFLSKMATGNKLAQDFTIPRENVA